MKKVIVMGLGVITLLVLAWIGFRLAVYGQVRGKITFTRWDAEAQTAAIYLTNALGFTQTRLTDDSGHSPSWSPDGGRLVYDCTTETGVSHICLMDTAGSNPQPLTGAPVPPEYKYPAWSPNSEKIVFEGHFNAAVTELFVINADGTGLTQITELASISSQPTWSPDGNQIAFAVETDTNSEIYLMNMADAQQVKMTDDPAPDLHPIWSPDSQYIFFESRRTGDWEIYRMQADGSELMNLTNSPLDDTAPVISPDGSRIAYTVSDGEGLAHDIYVMNVDGTAQRQLTNTPDFEFAPTWSPDSQNIAYISDPQGSSNSALYVMKADGQWQMRLAVGGAIMGVTWQS